MNRLLFGDNLKWLALRFFMNASRLTRTALAVLAVTCCASSKGNAAFPPVTVEVFVRTKGGETVRLSGARMEVAESVAPPESLARSDLRIFKPVRGFENILTDAEGKAEVKGLQPNYYVVVFDERQILNENERYLWIVAAGEAREGKLLLSHHNLFSGTFEKLLLLTRFGINALDPEGWAALHRAAIRGDKDVAEFLLAEGANVNAKDYSGKTPLHHTAIKGNKGLAELLLAKGADVNARTESGSTPLHNAAFWGKTETAELLLAKGADVNAREESGDTPLYDAILMDRKDVTELLLAKGADVNARGTGSNTPLHLAAHNELKDVAELLLAKGANVNARNDKGRTPLDDAVEKEPWDDAVKSGKKKEVVELLGQHGAKTGRAVALGE